MSDQQCTCPAKDMRFGRCCKAQPGQEPYGWISNEDGWFRKHEIADLAFKADAIPLYTAPPKREWVGLTGDEQDAIVGMANDSLDAICLTEDKLKEKNT